jgi:hypothetical protein
LTVADTVTILGFTDSHDENPAQRPWLLFAQEFRTFDMSACPWRKMAANAPASSRKSMAINVVFEWHTFDHIATQYLDLTQASFIMRINAVTIDPTDNNLLASLRTTSRS